MKKGEGCVPTRTIQKKCKKGIREICQLEKDLQDENNIKFNNAWKILIASSIILVLIDVIFLD